MSAIDFDRPTQIPVIAAPGALPPGGGCVAEVWFGDQPWARIAELDANGALIGGPHPPPPVRDPIIGKTFPRDVRAVIAPLLVDDTPEPLWHDVERVVMERTLEWADL